MAMTMVDPATGWFEIAELPYIEVKQIKENNIDYIDKTSARISQLFDKVWLSRYPRPTKVVFDNGSEFKKDFQILLKDWGIKPKCTTVKNPQANAPVERIHQVLKNMLRTKELQDQTFNYVDTWGSILASIAWAIRASYHSTLNHTPSQLVFGRDMLLNITSMVNWKDITMRKHKQVIKDNQRENKKRIIHDYQVGNQVYIETCGVHRKLEAPRAGPYPITAVFTNGTVRIQHGIINEWINICRLTPHIEL